MRVIFFYLQQFIELLFTIIHELSHWIVAFILGLLIPYRFYGIPKIYITRYPKIYKNNNDGYTKETWSMICQHEINYGNSRFSKIIACSGSMLVSAAPLITGISLLFILKGYLLLILIIYFDILLLSRGDIRNIRTFYNAIKQPHTYMLNTEQIRNLVEFKCTEFLASQEDRFSQHLSNEAITGIIMDKFEEVYRENPLAEAKSLAYRSCITLFEVILERYCKVSMNGHHVAQAFSEQFKDGPVHSQIEL